MTTSSSCATAGRMLSLFSSGTTTETKMSRLIRPSGWSCYFLCRRRQRLVQVVDIIDLAAQNGDDIGRCRIALEQDRPAVVDPALRQDGLDLPQRSHVSALFQDGHIACRVTAHSIEARAQRERRGVRGIAVLIIGP